MWHWQSVIPPFLDGSHSETHAHHGQTATRQALQNSLQRNIVGCILRYGFFIRQAVDVSGPLPNAATLLMAIWMLRFIFLYKRNLHFGKSCLFLQEPIIIVVPVCVAEPFGHSKFSTAFTSQISKGYGAKHLIEHLSRRLCVHIASVISPKNVPQHLSFLTP